MHCSSWLHRRAVLAVLVVLATVSGAAAIQQKVDYIITVRFDPAARTIGGYERISYYNFSNDKLTDLYVHLYWNAFQPGSMMEAQMRATGETALANHIAELTPEEQGRVTIDSVVINGKTAPFAIVGSIMRVALSQPIVAGNAADVVIAFTSHVPALVRRAGYMSADSIEFSMAQWYPKVCAYDEHGWHADQYLGKEFYGEYGRFNVNITAPHEYCIVATGFNINPQASGCGYSVRNDTTILFPAQRDSNTRDQHMKLVDTASIRRWQFEASNVHDFAWAADREFVHQILNSKLKTIHVFYKRRYQSAWQNIGKESAKAMEYLADHYGAYPYDQISVVQAGDGGMEYPQIIFLRGTPTMGTLVHELAHQWFYGIYGNNESAEAWLDEGFTTFATTRAMHELYADQHPPRTWLGGILLPHPNPLQDQYRPYMRIALSGHEEPMLQHSDAFAENETYREVYYKTNAILNMLEYTVGDSTFAHIMRTYCEKYRLAHPTTEGFIRVCQDVSGMSLQWFFDEWLRTTKTCDYAISSANSRVSDSGYVTTLSLRRCGKAVMPVDVDLTYDDASHQLVTVPQGWYAKVERDNIILPQWGAPFHTYEATFTTRRSVASAVIDPSMRLQDINRLNNETGLIPPMRIGFLTRFDADPPLDAYAVSFVPRLWYSAMQGTKIGVSLDGGYAYDRKIFRAGVYLNTLHNTADWWLNYRLHLAPNADVFLDGAEEYGIRSATIRAEQRFRRLLSSPTEHRFSLQYRYTDLSSSAYPFYTILWSRGEVNSAKAAYRFTMKGTTALALDASFESSLTKQSGFTRADISAKYDFPMWMFNNSVHVTAGTAGGALPVQKQYFLSAADPEEQYANTVFRDLAMVSQSLDTSAHLYLPGGGGLVGYMDRYAMLTGLTMVSVTAECSLPVLRGDHAVSVAAFGGWGYITDQTFSSTIMMGAPYVDAGVSLKYEFNGGDASLLQSLLLTKAPLIVQVSVPFFVSRPVAGENEIARRVRVGISAAL